MTTDSPATAAPVTMSRETQLRIFFVGVLALGLVLRLVGLGDRPLHHDESLDAWFSWRFLEGTYEGYDPVYHGPLRFYLTGAFYWLFGEGEASARLLPALCGTALIGLPYFLRHRIGMVASAATALILCLSPAFLYYSRFAREDAMFAFLTFALALAVLAQIARPTRWLPSVIVLIVVAMWGVKESVFIVGFVLGSFLLVAVAEQLWNARRQAPTPPAAFLLAGLALLVVAFSLGEPIFVNLGWYGVLLGGAVWVATVDARRRGVTVDDVPVLRAVVAPGRDAWLVAGAVGAVAFVAVFTVGFTNWAGSETVNTPWNSVVDGLRGGLEYWRGQQDTNRGGEPWYYYLYAIPAYEWPALLLAGVGVGRIVRRPTTETALFLWAAVASLAAYSWAGERMPWLILHPLLPLLVLAGIGAQVLWDHRRRTVSRAAAVLAVVLLGVTTYTSVQASFVRDTEPRELLTQAGQASDDLSATVDRLFELDGLTRAQLGRPLQVVIDSSESAAWPYVWYLRDLESVSYLDMGSGDPPSSADVVIVGSRNEARVQPLLIGFDPGVLQVHRSWWVPTYNDGWFAGWAGWLIDRDVWDSGVGSLDEVVYVRSEIAEFEQIARLVVP